MSGGINPGLFDPTIAGLALENGGNLDILANNGSVVNSDNSTTTPLGGGGVYTGTGTDCLGYSNITITIYADQNSAIDGMCFQFSTDNVNWDDTYAFTLDTANSNVRRFQFPTTARYFRVFYTNGGSAQSAFRVQTMLHRTNVLTSIHRIEDNVSTDRSAILVKSALIAQVNGTGDFIPIQANAGGILKIGGSVELDAGTNNIGDVDVLTQPARDRLTDNIGVAHQTDVIMNDTTALTPKFAVINLSATGDIVSLVAGKKIRVLALTLMSAGTVNVTLRTGGTTAITGVMPLVANTGFVLPYNPVGWFETASGAKLDALLSASVDVDGFLTYVEV